MQVRGVVSNALSLVPKGGSADGAAQAVGVVVADEEGAGATMKVLDTATRRVIVEERVPGLDLGAQGGPSLAFFSAFLKKDGGFGFRAMVMGNDATLALIQQVIGRRRAKGVPERFPPVASLGCSARRCRRLLPATSATQN